MKKFLFGFALLLVSLVSQAQAPPAPNVRLAGDLKTDSTTSRPRKGEYRLFFNARNQPRVLDYLGNTTGLRDLLGVITGGSGISQSFADGRYLLNTYVPTWASITGKPTIPVLPAWLPTNDPAYLTSSYVPTWASISGKPVIPTNTNQLTNGSGYVSDTTGLVRKITGKGLSTKDFTQALLDKLNGIAAGATNVTDNAQLANGAGYAKTVDVTTQLGVKLSISDTVNFVRKLSGYRLLSPAEITKLANTSGTNTGDETATSIRSKLGITTLSGSNTGDQIITNNATTTTAGTALDAVWGKILKDAVDANTASITGKLAIGDTVNFVRKLSGYRLLSPAEQTKLANTSGTNSGDQQLSFNSSTGVLTISGSNGNGVTIPTGGGGGGTLPISYLASASEFASSTTNYAFFDGNVWVRSAGTVQTDPVEQNGKYTATQYNGSGSFHYDRQFDGPVNFRWWQRASADNHNRLRAMLNSGYSEMKVDSGTYYFDSYAWTPNNFRITGDLANPSKVKFVLRGANAVDNSPNTRIFRGWFWFDGSGIPFENITIEGIRFINECTATITGTPNNATGSNAAIHFDGSVQRNINVNRCEYVQRSKTAATNFAYFKAGPNKLQENIVISNSRTDNPDSTRARMFVEFVNQDAPNNNKVAGRGIQIINCFIRGVYYGTSIAGNYDNALVEKVTYENCRDYGSEFAGKNANATLLNCRFGGTHNVLFVSNYHGDNGTSSGDPAIPANSGQQFIGNRTLGYVPGIVELRGSGNLFMQNNNLNISGGLYLRANSLGGVISGDLKDNTITTNAIATNMTNKAVVFLEGATNIRATGNTFNRTSTDTQPMVQAASSTAQDGATGTPSTGSQFIGNFLYSGAGTLSSYFSATSPNNLSIGSNYNATGQINQ